MKAKLVDTFPKTIYQIMSDKIYEGLILTHDLNIITNIISKKYKAIFYYDKNIFEISHKFDDKLFNIEINEIIQLTDNLGWFPSQIIYYVNENQKYLKFSLTNFLNLIKLKIYDMNIFFEAKYDIDIYPIPEKMYHVTNLRYLEKIKRYGLIPHKHEKLTSHPERIYLTNSIDESWIFIRALIFRTPENEREPLIILEIDTLFMKDRLRIMRDPNFQRGGIYTGFYTLNPIDPQCLSVIDIIYPNDLKNL